MSGRSFVLIQHDVRTDAEFSIDGTANNGRLDIGCRFLNSVLFTSYSLRRDVDAHLIFKGPPDPPLHLHFSGKKISGLHPDERSIAGYIKKNLKSFENRSVTANKGVMIDRRNLETLLKDLEGRPVLLHEEGESINSFETPENPVFVLGDHLGIEEEEIDLIESLDCAKMSLGTQSYQAQQVASFLNIWMDMQAEGQT
ncbi:MAG: tRNA (pseudouridine(54)-N(1))-methyltransferase TrmY [Candidatus Nanohaloarchaea archaeon]|nr:tRNA (pseudouridine(54)-N(1))-methyltransferase TrmY [Candidatus Nanohaloarchaea archaeon]